jgi:RNA polymerase sigma-70 factor, ECF subfamily
MTATTTSTLDREPTISPVPAVQSPSNWPGLVERIRARDPSAMEELYKMFSTGIRFLLYRQLGPQDLDDKVHDVFVIITEAICNGELREPDRLMGYVHTVVRRQVASHIDRAIHLRRNRVDVDFQESVSDKRPDPEREAINRETLGLAMRVLQSIPKRDREVLTRFYLNEESVDEICQNMGLSETQFRLIKSRAKARFGELGKRRLAIRRALRA